MGSFFTIGYKFEGKASGARSLNVGLNRYTSMLMEGLFNEVFQEKFPVIHEKIMEIFPLDQISFGDLSSLDFNIAIRAIRDFLAHRTEAEEWQVRQKDIWQEHFEPLVLQDFRYEIDTYR